MLDQTQIARDQASRERELIAVIRGLVSELQPRRGKSIDVRLSSRLDRDLGIDSLGRTELILRIERAFRVRLPISVVGEAETVGDVLRELHRAQPRRGPPRAEPVAPILPAVSPASEARTWLEV